jgi:Outer membrane protein beta-barrel family
MFKILSILFFLIIGHVSFAQTFKNEMKLEGKITDSTSTGVKDVMLMAIRTRDSLLLSYTRTDANGKFNLNGFEADTFQLIAAKKSYNDIILLILGSAQNKDLDLGALKMGQNAKELGEVIVYANKNPMYFKGDTLMYVADSFKMKEGAVVEDLLKKLPGVQVQKDGKIKVNGKDVDKVLVDGDEFFGSDAKMATQNLEAKSIENIAVYEEGNAADDGEKKQVLDLRLKDEAKKGYFGKADVGSDFNKFHNGKLTFNRFNGQQKIGAYIIGSTLPNSTLGWQDNYEMGFDPGYSYDEDENTWLENDTYIGDLGSGLPQALRGGLVFNDQLTKKYKFSANYIFNDTRLTAKKTENIQYLLQDTTYSENSAIDNESHSQSHAFALKNEIKLDSLTTLDINGSVSLKLEDNIVQNNLNFLSRELVNERNNLVAQSSDDETKKGKIEFKLKRDFKKKRRNLKVDYAIVGNEIDNNLDSKSKNAYTSTATFDSLYRKIGFGVKELKQTGYFSYSEPLNKFFTLSFSNKIIFEKSAMQQLNNGLSAGKYVLDSTISSSFSTTRVSNLAKVLLKFERKKDAITLGLGYKNLDRKSNDKFTNLDNTLNAGGFVPSLGYRRKISGSSQFRINYELKRDFPSFDETQRGTNVSDPNNIVRSNINLKPSLGNNLSMNFNSYSMLTDQYMYLGSNAGVIKDAIVSTFFYDAFGRSVSTYENVDGNKFVNVYVGIGKAFFKKWLKIDLNLSQNYNVNNSITNGIKNQSTNNNANVGLELKHETDTITYYIGADFSRFGSKSNLNDLSRAPQYTQNYSAGFNMNLPFNFIIDTDINYSIRSGLSSGFNRKIAIWNIALRKKFKKDGPFELFAKVNDVLNQNIEISRNFSPTLITDSKTNVVARYFQVGFVWKFKNKIATAKPEEDVK